MCEQNDGNGPTCCGDCVPKRYNIIRMREGVGRRIIHRGLTLVEAQAHCHRSDTHGPGWFDGYEKANS